MTVSDASSPFKSSATCTRGVSENLAILELDPLDFLRDCKYGAYFQEAEDGHNVEKHEKDDNGAIVEGDQRWLLRVAPTPSPTDPD